MLETLARNWGSLVLRGVAGIVFGLILLINPRVSLTLLVYFFGAWALVDGLFAIFASLANRGEEPRWVALLLAGIAGVLIGVMTFFWPGVTAVVLLFLIGVWAIAVGIGEIVAALRLRKLIDGEWILLLAGLVSVAFGVLLLFFPGAGALAMIAWIAAAAIVLGILRVGLGLRLRKSMRREGGVEG